jgi:predicted dehydrogenase
MKKKRIAFVGTGGRALSFIEPVATTYREANEIVALCDLSPARMAYYNGLLAGDLGYHAVPAYTADRFDEMLRVERPDTVFVCTKDSTHHDYIVRALHAGCDVITEKPMTTDAAKCRAILDAQRATGRRVRVAFNYRWAPFRTKVKELIASGTIGRVRSVNLEYLLDTNHGADYFRRWHASAAESGTLLVHKSTHHFDLVNWWLGAAPESVYATGKREFYTPAMAKRLGLQSHHERCHTCPEQDKCGFFFSLANNPGLKALYLDQEKYDGYHRDQCVFAPRIDIEDTMNVLVTYDNKVTLAYSLNAFNSWEGYHIVFNGTKGRLEHTIVEQIYVNAGSSDAAQGAIADGGVTTRVIPLRGEARKQEPWTGTGSHGGGDKVMLDEIFLPDAPADKYLRASNEHAGANSILIGVAANECFKSGLPVKIADLVTGLEKPKYAPMPSRTGPLPMPERLSIRRGAE